MADSPVSPAPAGNPSDFEPTRIGQMPPPLLLNRYQVVRLLGRGASGEVLEVKDLATGSSYAFKRVSSELSQHAVQFQALQSNFVLVSQLAHPHIATTRFFERDPQSGDVCLLMDLVRGQSLAEYLSTYRSSQGDPEAPLPVPLALGIAEQVAAALDYAHAQPSTWNPDGSPKRFGVLHRDLKPMNVMLESAREYRPGVPFVKLVDFGLAAEIQASLTSLSIAAPQNNEICGTPGYMAPEQWEGRTLTRGVDQWALAVMIYEMVAGRPPFRAPSQLALMEQIRRAQPEKPATLTDLQWRALSKTFTVDRKDRYPSCVTLVRTVAQSDPRTTGAVQVPEQALPVEDPSTALPAITTDEEPPPNRTQKRLPRRPPATAQPAQSRSHGLLIAVVVLLLLVVAGGGLAGFLWFQGQQGAGLQRAVDSLERVSVSGQEDEIAKALSSLEKAERDFPYASDSARAASVRTRERLLARRDSLAGEKRASEQTRDTEKKRHADYLAALDGVRRILGENNPDQLEDADVELAKAGPFADTPEKRQQVTELRKQIAQQLKDRKDVAAILLFTTGLEIPGNTETSRAAIEKALLSRYRILPTDRLLAAAADLKHSDLRQLTSEDLGQVTAKAGARHMIKVALAPSGATGDALAASGELIAVDKGVVQRAVLEVKNFADFVDRIPTLVSILHMTDDEKDAYLAARRKRDEERAAELAQLERERRETERKQQELEEQRLKAEQERQRLAEEKRLAEAAAEQERQKRLEQERLAKLDAARREAEKQAAEAAAERERQQRLELERAAKLALEKAQGTAQIRRVWIEHNQMVNNEKGMKIHVHFTVQWRKDIPGHLAAFFYWENGNKAIIPGGAGQYTATDGQVVTEIVYTPNYDDSEFKDAVLFIPNRIFSDGEYKFHVIVRTNNGQTLLADSEYQHIKVGQ